MKLFGLCSYGRCAGGIAELVHCGAVWAMGLYACWKLRIVEVAALLEL